MATLLSNIAEGSIVKIKENGIPVDFYVAKHNYESALNGTGRTLLVRKDCYDLRAWHDDALENAYATSYIDAWLNGDYMARLDADVQQKIGTTAFYYTPGNGNTTVQTLSRAVFILSLTEVAKSSGNNNKEGSALPIASALSIAYIDGVAVSQWSRTPYNITTYSSVFYITESGSVAERNLTVGAGTRPAFTLPAAETYISDDGSVEFSVPTISGEDASFGPQHTDFTISYTVTTTNGSAATVTEKVDGTVVRTYTAQSGAAQSMAVAIAGLAAGEHTVTITADLNGATVERRYTIVVSSILMAYDETELGVKNSDFSIPYSAVENTGANITITEYLDGAVVRRYTAASGSQQSLGVSVGYLVDGEHTATIQAESRGETATATFTFTVPAHHLTDGTIQELQDHEGKLVLPVTLARAVLTGSGRSVEAALEHIFEVATAELVD